MAIDLYSNKTNENIPTWKKILFVISIILFLIVLCLFLYQQFLKIPNNDNEMKRVQRELNMQGTSDQLKQKELVLGAEEKIAKFKQIYDGKPEFSKFFSEFESWTYPRVSFFNFGLDLASNTLTAEGKTDTLQSLMQQMALFNNEKNVEKYSISSISLEDGDGVTFNISIVINPNLFKNV